MKCLKSILPVSLLSVSELVCAHYGHGEQIGHGHEFVNTVYQIAPDLLLVVAIVTPNLLLSCRHARLRRAHRGTGQEGVA